MKSKLLFIGLFSASLVFQACKKNDPSPTSVPPLSKAESTVAISQSNIQFVKDSVEFKAATTTVTSAISNLSTTNAIPSNLSASIPSLRSEGSSNEDGVLLSAFASQLAAIGLNVTNPSLLNGRIPNTFDAAKGIWELQTKTSSSSFSGSSVCYSSGSANYYYFKREFVKTGSSDKIVIKFPSRSFSSYFDCASYPNNATYTISALETAFVTYSSCSYQGIKVTRTDTVATKLNAGLNIDGNDVMVYNYSSNSTFLLGQPTSYTASMKIGNFDYAANSNVATNYSSGEFNLGWKKNGTNITNLKLAITGDGYDISNIACTSNSGTNEIYKTLTKYFTEYERSGLRVVSDVNIKGYLTELNSKYGSPKNGLSYYDTTTYIKILSDTVLTDKYYNNMGLYQASNGAKIGDLKIRISKTSYGNGSYKYTYYSHRLIIYYSDGTKEPLTNKINGYFYVYIPFSVYTSN